jgi:hypothetical protein
MWVILETIVEEGNPRSGLKNVMDDKRPSALHVKSFKHSRLLLIRFWFFPYSFSLFSPLFKILF